MHLFRVIATGQPGVTMFAASYSDAANLFTAYWLLTQDVAMPDFEIRWQHEQAADGDAVHLRGALALNIAGVGLYDPEKGWTIVPPERFEEIA